MTGTVVYTARVVTESLDTYVWVYGYEPTRQEVIQRLHDFEMAADMEFYEDSTTVYIESTTIISAPPGKVDFSEGK